MSTAGGAQTPYTIPTSARSYPPLKDTNGLGNANTAGQKTIYPGKYHIYSRKGSERSKRSGTITVAWEPSTDNIVQNTYAGICVNDCISDTSVYSRTVVTNDLDYSKPLENQYSPSGNGNLYVVPDPYNTSFWFVARVFFSTSIDDTFNHYVYWSTSSDCDCSVGQCDRNMGKDANKMGVKDIPGALSGEKYTYYGDAGCNMKKKAMKFFFPKGTNTEYHLCVQKEGSQNKKGTPVKHTTGGVASPVTIKIERTATTVPSGRVTQITSPSALSKISGLATILITLAAFIIM